MNTELQATLAHFGHDSLRPGQEEAIIHLANDCDTLVVMPTGIGKSLIFQVMAMLLPGITIIISPLIALMKDQVDNLTSRGIPATFINSTLSPAEKNKRLEEILQHKYKLVYVAPERLRQYFFSEDMKRMQISLIAVDEAHCISQWGHDFRPDYLAISEFRQLVGEPLTVALTATATPRVRTEIISSLKLERAAEVVTGFDRPNIKFTVRPIISTYKTKSAKLSELANLLKGWKNGTAIVYAGRRKEAEKAAWFLREVIGVNARHYHAGLATFERDEIQEEFINGHLPVIVATNAFGMGIDRPDVRLVLHLTMPGSIEAYYQEAGRAGRDGKQADAVLLYSATDQKLQEYFIENSRLSYDDMWQLFNTIIKRGGGRSPVWINPDELSERCGFDKEGVKVRVGLQRLEEAEVISQEYYQGLERLIQIYQWDYEAVTEVAKKIDSHCDHKMQLMGHIIRYSESSKTCRRKIILDYFDNSTGFKGSKVCCDVCDKRPASKPASVKRSSIKKKSKSQKYLHTSDRPGPRKTIITCAYELNGFFSLKQMAGFLTATITLPSELRKNPYYGCLSRYPTADILHRIHQLCAKGYLEMDERRKLIPGPKAAPYLTGKNVPSTTPVTNPELKRDVARLDSPTPNRTEILSCVRDLRGKLSKTELAQLLIGSPSPKIHPYRGHRCFGRLSKFTKKQILSELAALLKQGRLTINSKRKITISAGPTSNKNTKHF